MILPWYYLPLYRDFPQFFEYGARWDQHPCSDGFVFKDKENCLALYSLKHDPTQERSASEIARFSKKDAETWRKLWSVSESDKYQRMLIDTLFLPAEDRLTGAVMERQGMLLPKVMEAGFMPDMLAMKASSLRTAQEWFESPELQCCILRMGVSGGFDITEPGTGLSTMGMALTIPTIGFNRGGTHQIAHAAHQLLVQMGCRFLTNQHVDKAIIENGRATGIRLADGSEVAACKIVVSTLSPHQLIFELIGEEHVDQILKKWRQADPRHLRLSDVVPIRHSRGAEIQG